MSVYSYVELKVHTNVQKVGTHLNMWLIYRTYVRWKYTCLFAYKKYCSLYLYIMNIPLSCPFSTFSLSLYYTISIYRNENTLSRTLPFPATFFPPPLFTLLLYTLYIERKHFPAPFYPSYKVNTFSTAPFPYFLKCYLWEKFAGKSFLKLY